jgi:hypothetical protein
MPIHNYTIICALKNVILPDFCTLWLCFHLKEECKSQMLQNKALRKGLDIHMWYDQIVHRLTAR